MERDFFCAIIAFEVLVGCSRRSANNFRIENLRRPSVHHARERLHKEEGSQNLTRQKRTNTGENAIRALRF